MFGDHLLMSGAGGPEGWHLHVDLLVMLAVSTGAGA